MIIETCEQGSAEWRALHCAIPTASSFHKIIAPSGKPSAQRDKYLAEKVAEYFYGDCLDNDFGRTAQQFMERGKSLESEARARFEFEHNVEVEEVGMVLTDDRLIGCSPDGLIGEDAGCEFKAYELVHHVGAALKHDNAHYVQVQGCLWVTGRKVWHRVYYHPRFPSVTFTFERDEEFIEALAESVQLFVADMMQSRAYLEERGWQPIRLTKCPHSGIDTRVCRCEACNARRNNA